MTNVAIIVGNVEYDSQTRLACCEQDVIAVRELIEATGRFGTVKTVLNADADRMKEDIREALSVDIEIDEIFFYFTGHGSQGRSDFFFCPSNFDLLRPNETGLSNDELHTLFRSSNPNLVVKVIDACNSGTSLIKANDGFLSIRKGDLKHVIQIASCLNSQHSLTGDPLSHFTESFCRAALRKSEGAVFYTDITNTLRDDYLNDDNQTPYFVSQGTGREVFIEDAARLNECREKFKSEWFVDDEQPVDEDVGDEAVHAAMLELITNSEVKFAKPEKAKILIDQLLDGIIDRVTSQEFSDFFEVTFVEHSNYKENATKEFIIRSLMSEKRPDNFVTASMERQRKKSSPFSSAIMGLSSLYGNEFVESWILELNCTLPRVQMKVVFTPKFTSLNQMTMIISCAPSLNKLYVFELSTQNVRTDWNEFDPDGKEIDKHWYSVDWDDSINWLVDGVCVRLLDAVQSHLEQTTKRLSSE